MLLSLYDDQGKPNMTSEATGLTASPNDCVETAHGERDFVLQKVQPALMGLMDGSVSTLAPLFATAELTGKPLTAFFVGLAASVGAGISMGLAEGLSDDGKVTGRGTPLARGIITGLATTVGGMLHTFPFLIPKLYLALRFAYVVVIIELLAIAYTRFHYMKSPLVKTIVQVIVGGGIVFAIGILLGRLGAGT
jgi:VIT1/CCC1 family predicted Fe2+/Mn2+ transporter